MRKTEDYIRVSDVLEPYFKKEYIPPDVLQAAQERGSDVHDGIELYLKGMGNWIEPQNQKYFQSFLKWTEKEKFEVSSILSLEERLFDDELMLTGKYDMIYQTLQGEKVLIDYKTSSSPSKSWPLQLGAYRHLARSLHEISYAMVLHLQKDGSIAKQYIYENQWETFKSAYDIYVYFNPTKLKRKK